MAHRKKDNKMITPGTLCLIRDSGTDFDGYSATVVGDADDNHLVVLIREAICVTVPKKHVAILCTPEASLKKARSTK